jgi:hypothetical protein
MNLPTSGPDASAIRYAKVIASPSLAGTCAVQPSRLCFF